MLQVCDAHERLKHIQLAELLADDNGTNGHPHCFKGKSIYQGLCRSGALCLPADDKLYLFPSTAGDSASLFCTGVVYNVEMQLLQPGSLLTSIQQHSAISSARPLSSATPQHGSQFPAAGWTLRIPDNCCTLLLSQEHLKAVKPSPLMSQTTLGCQGQHERTVLRACMLCKTQPLLPTKMLSSLYLPHAQLCTAQS